jgi:hypothetical protein
MGARFSRIGPILVCAAAVLFIQQSAWATVWNLDAILDGLQETPPVATPGSGSATMTLDDVTNQFTLTGTFQDLIGTTNNAHVHGPAPVGTPAGVMFPITFDFGVTSGNISFNGVITSAQAADILNELSYINIHTSFRPGGEIRGQILVVPEPSSLMLFALAAPLAVARRRRK